MNIISTQYTLKYKSFEIVLSGCKGKNGTHCKECHSPETWDFNIGTFYQDNINNIINKICDSSDMIDWIWIYGGEPNDNNLSQLKTMLMDLKRETGKPIMLFTRYDIKEIPDFEKNLCDYIKCGEYIPELKSKNIQYGVELATSNQKIYKKGKDY